VKRKTRVIARLESKMSRSDPLGVVCTRSSKLRQAFARRLRQIAPVAELGKSCTALGSPQLTSTLSCEAFLFKRRARLAKTHWHKADECDVSSMAVPVFWIRGRPGKGHLSSLQAEEGDPAPGAHHASFTALDIGSVGSICSSVRLIVDMDKTMHIECYECTHFPHQS
jgi:hypothetical protein